MVLDLKYVILVEEEEGNILRSSKVILHLASCNDGKKKFYFLFGLFQLILKIFFSQSNIQGLFLKVYLPTLKLHFQMEDYQISEIVSRKCLWKDVGKKLLRILLDPNIM